MPVLCSNCGNDTGKGSDPDYPFMHGWSTCDICVEMSRERPLSSKGMQIVSNRLMEESDRIRRTQYPNSPDQVFSYHQNKYIDKPKWWQFWRDPVKEIFGS